MFCPFKMEVSFITLSTNPCVYLGRFFSSPELEGPVKLVVRIVQDLGEIYICDSQPLAIVLQYHMDLEADLPSLQVLKEGSVNGNLNI